MLLSHNSACVSIATGALEGSIEKQERINRVEAAATAVGLDQGEFNSLERKMNRVASCLETVENTENTEKLQNSNNSHHQTHLPGPSQPAISTHTPL